MIKTCYGILILPGKFQKTVFKVFWTFEPLKVIENSELDQKMIPPSSHNDIIITKTIDRNTIEGIGTAARNVQKHLTFYRFSLGFEPLRFLEKSKLGQTGIWNL